MKILIYSDNEWVIESVEKYIDFEYDLMKNIDFEDLNERIDFILVAVSYTHLTLPTMELV